MLPYTTVIKMLKILIVVVSTISPALSENTRSICVSEECKISSDILKSCMDTKINPCDNFYQYACGNFPNYKKSMYRKSERYNWFLEAERKIQTKIEYFIRSSTESTDSVNVKKIKTFYQTCMDADSMSNEGLETIKYVLRLVNVSIYINFGKQYYADPNFDWMISTAKLKINFNIDFLISVYVDTDSITGVKYLALGYPKLCSPNFNYMFQELKIISLQMVLESQKFESYVDAIAIPLLKLHNNTQIHRLEKRREFLNFQKFSQLQVDICMESERFMLIEKIWNINISTKKKTLKELQMFTDRLTKHSLVKINWRKYLETIFEDIDGFHLSEDDVLLVNELYLKKLFNLTRTTSSRTLELAIWFETVRNVLPYTTNELKQIDNEFREKLLTSSEKLKSSEFCVELTNKFMKLPILQYMVYNSEAINYEHEVLEMISHLKIALQKLIDESEWMDKRTKVTAVDKIKEIKSRIVCPIWLKNTTYLDMKYKKMTVSSNFLKNLINVNRIRFVIDLLMYINKTEELYEDFIHHPLEVNAFYDLKRNLITVPLGILQRPFYSHPLQVLNYGAMGSIIGHEITHGLDTAGRRFNKEGNINNWWTNITLDRFNKRTHCFVNSYSRIKIGNYSCNGVNTLDENIADSSGVREAFVAYQEYKKLYRKESLLIGFENFTHEQLFTLAYANVWCEHKTEVDFETDFKNKHSPNEIRVLGVFQNSEDFSKIWKCSKGSTMNPHLPKCRLWRKK